MNANGVTEDSQWQAHRALPLVSMSSELVRPEKATQYSRAPSAREDPPQHHPGSRSLSAAYPWLSSRRQFVAFPLDLLDRFIRGISRRFQRERRRRKVGRAYDMALEIARVVPRGSEVLDVGCGNGYIAHHLSALLGATVSGIDLEESTEAPIDYSRYDGQRFPAENNSCDAVLLCYVLHHAQDVSVMLKEIRRVVRDGGLAIIYEDIPATWWDRFVCSIHNKQWKNRTGVCTFRDESGWRDLFEDFGFEVSSERQLSRMRNLTHPVRRRRYVVRYATTLPHHPVCLARQC